MGYGGYHHEELRKPFHKEKKFSPKLLGLIVLILVISIAAFISSSPTQVKETASITGYAVVDLSDKDLAFDSMFTSYGILEVNASKTDTVVIKTTSPSNFNLAGEELDLSDLPNAEITLTNFQGKIRVKDQKIFLDGTSESLYLNTIGISRKRSVVGWNTDFDSAHISNVRLSDQTFEHMVGHLTVSEKTKLELDDSKIFLKTFKGNVFVDENLTIAGLVDTVSVKNKDHKVDISE